MISSRLSLVIFLMTSKDRQREREKEIFCSEFSRIVLLASWNTSEESLLEQSLLELGGMITPMISSPLSFLQKVSFLLPVHSWHSKRTTLERTKFQREGRTVEAETSFESKRRRKREQSNFTTRNSLSLGDFYFLAIDRRNEQSVLLFPFKHKQLSSIAFEITKRECESQYSFDNDLKRVGIDAEIDWNCAWEDRQR